MKMRQDSAREGSVDKRGASSQDDLDEEEKKADDQETYDSNDGNEESLKEHLDRFHQGSSGTSPISTRNGREPPPKEQRDRPDQGSSSKLKDRTAHSSLELQGRERLPGASPRPDTRSHGRSGSYNTKEYAHDMQCERPSNESGHRSQSCDEKFNTARDQYSTASGDNYGRHAHREHPESHTTATTRNPQKAAARGNAHKQKHASGQKNTPEETQEEYEKRKWMALMQKDPSYVYDCFVQEIRKLETETNEWQARVNLLSEEMLAGRDRFQPATDGDLKSKMNKLREDVKALARELNPKQISEKTFSGTLEGQLLSSHRVEKIWTKKPFRSPLLQSSIWCVLVRHMFSTPFAVFGKEGVQVEIAWRTLFGEPSSKHDPLSDKPSSDYEGLSHEDEDCCSGQPRPEELCEKWKSMTATRLKDKAAESRKAGSVSTGKDAKVALQKMLDVLSVSTNQPSEEPSWVGDLKNVLHSAAELAMLMAQQRSRLELFVPDLRKIEASEDHCCDGKTIDFDEGVEGPLNGSPGLIVTPGLRKWGDGLGGNLSRCVDLEAAQVKCT